MRSCGYIIFLFLSLALLTLSGCGKKTDTSAGEQREASKLEAFFVQWLKGHNEKDIVVDDKGVGLKGNPTRLKASLYGSQPSEKGGQIVELEFKITLPDGQVIIEYLAGMGDTEEKAINDG